MPIAAASFSDPGPPYFAHQEVAEEDQLEHERHRRGAASQPTRCPTPCAPTAMPLTRPNSVEDDDEFGGRDADAIGARRALEEVDGARHAADDQRRRARAIHVAKWK